MFNILTEQNKSLVCFYINVKVFITVCHICPLNIPDQQNKNKESSVNTFQTVLKL